MNNIRLCWGRESFCYQEWSCWSSGYEGGRVDVFG